MPEILNVVRHIASLFAGLMLSIPFIGPFFDVFTSLLVDGLRLFHAGMVAKGVDKCARPAKPLQLYEYEGCPFCRKVRETLSVLDIDHIVYPCPRETLRQCGVVVNSRFRPTVQRLGGKLQFPFLVDSNTDSMLYESDEIVKYLWKTYGDKATPSAAYKLANNPKYWKFSMRLISLLRPRGEMGVLRAPTKKPERLLELYGFESSPFVRRVREVLSSLELPYVYHVVPKKSAEKRKVFLAEYGDRVSNLRKKTGFIQVPLLKDPNTGLELLESADIVEYLRRNYQTAPVARDTWLEYGALDKKKD